jgi:hypothetical protein
MSSGSVLTSTGFRVEPLSLDFGEVVLGTMGEIPITITNLTAASLQPNFSGGAPLDPANFGGSQNCAGKIFAPGDSCTFTYSFEPATLGPHDSSTRIGSDGVNAMITMKGCGIVMGGSC